MIAPAAPTKTWVLAEFTTPDAALAAARTIREKGFADVDVYSPYPLHGADVALGLKRSKVPVIAGVGALVGVVTAYGFQYWMNAVDYPINVANRPPHSPPSFIPIVFELGVLICALSIFFGLWALSRLPQPYHPTSEIDAFRSASTHAFWLSVLTNPEKGLEAEEHLKTVGAAQTAQVQETPER